MNIHFFVVILTILQMLIIKNVLATWKIILQVASNDKPVAIFYIVLSALWNMIARNLQVDSFLFLILFILVGIDTLFGALLAKKMKTYDWDILRKKAFVKMQGYIYFLLSLFLVTAMIFIVSLKDGEPFLSEYIMNIPITTTFLFFGAIEFISIKNNIVAHSGIKTPTSVVDKFEAFVKTQNPTELLDNKKE